MLRITAITDREWLESDLYKEVYLPLCYKYGGDEERVMIFQSDEWARDQRTLFRDLLGLCRMKLSIDRAIKVRLIAEASSARHWPYLENPKSGRSRLIKKELGVLDDFKKEYEEEIEGVSRLIVERYERYVELK